MNATYQFFRSFAMEIACGAVILMIVAVATSSNTLVFSAALLLFMATQAALPYPSSGILCRIIGVISAKCWDISKDINPETPELSSIISVLFHLTWCCLIATSINVYCGFREVKSLERRSMP